MKLCVDCPAGVALGDLTARPLGCHCRVEDTIIIEGEGTPTLAQWCYADYTACPTWRAEKDAIRAGEHGAIISSNRRTAREATEMQRQVAAAQLTRLNAFSAGDDDTANLSVPELIAASR